MQPHATALRMEEAAAELIAALSPVQRTALEAPFLPLTERGRWGYMPTPPRDGLALFDMDPRQQRLAMKLVASGLSEEAYNVAAVILGLERVLDRREHWRRADPGRDPLRYWTRIFGRPSSEGPWGWRFEGHHVALHYTLRDRRVISPTPTFFGANPAEAPLLGAKLRPLGPLEDVARELVSSLDEEQRGIAIVSHEAPPDLLTGSASRVTHALMPPGLPARSMSPPQRSILDALVELYVSRLPDDVAETERQALRERGTGELAFAWAGSLELKRGHYYRLQDARFLVEYDNTQNDANHVHTVWRDPANDFGVNVLAAHYARHPH
ncbi:MAG: DUF3500 domain-containing protein [Myxococcota bacterium]|nr:DUF3500 domain-containing protein [Myxococcota bacterium]